MILNKVIASVVFFIAWIQIISGTSYSQVYVNSGSSGGPYQVVRYGAPPMGYGAPLAQLNAAPVGSAVPYPQASRYLQPCTAPCIPTQSAVVSIPNANLVTYSAPIVAAGDTPSTYQYSYVVYDDTTGDQKRQQELSDGGVVRGQYSFLQPDGYVRQVQYTADDTNGFNAVVNYLPGNVIQPAESKQANPCDQPKPEALKEAPASEKIKEAPESPPPDDSSETPQGDAASNEIPAQEESSPTENAEGPQSSTEAATEDSGNNIAPKENISIDTPAPESVTSEGIPAVVVETKPEKSVENAEVKSVPQPLAPTMVAPNVVPVGYITYDQFNCLQKLQDLRTNSPLTYVLLPSKPCV